MAKHKRKKKLRDLFNEQAGNCVYCLEPMEIDLGYSNTATVEHVVARSKGGEKKHFNEVAACWTCNTLKADMDINVWLKVNAARFKRDKCPPFE